MNKAPKNIIISRTDSIGDVVLTLPLAAVLKKYFPDTTIAFLGKSYTQSIIKACQYIDEFIDINDFLQNEIRINGEVPEAIIHVFPKKEIAFHSVKLNIPVRIGTTNRIYHWLTCNKLVKLSRKKSSLHEAQLNLKLLEPFKVPTDFSLDELRSKKFFGLTKVEPLPNELSKLIKKNTYNLILHPKSRGSGREWPLKNFIELIQILDSNRYTIFISGTDAERKIMQPLFDAVGDKIIDTTGMPLDEFISFINECDGLVASSTGPLHVAAALGKDALGIYPPIHPSHPGRWQPLGPRAKVFVLNKNCNDCKNKTMSCHCVAEINPYLIKEELDKLSSGLNS